MGVSSYHLKKVRTIWGKGCTPILVNRHVQRLHLRWIPIKFHNLTASVRPLRLLIVTLKLKIDLYFYLFSYLIIQVQNLEGTSGITEAIFYHRDRLADTKNVVIVMVNSY